MTHEQLNTAGFTVVGKKIEATTYKEYLQDYGSDETTSPRGVENRYHIREIKEFLMKDSEGKVIWESEYKELPDEEQDEYGYFAEDVKEYQIWSWGVNGNHPKFTGTSFENREDAEMCLYDIMETTINEYNNNTPIWHEDYESALAELADNLQRSVEVVKRYIALKKITERKESEHRAAITRENDARKEWIAIEAPKEAASIVVDDEFKAAVKWAEEATGNEKSTRMASALKGLLARNNKEKINTDFWQVLRILKSNYK